MSPGASKAALLDAAEELLTSGGAAALNIRAVATRAGCSTMGLYTHFGGKDGLLDELYALGFARLAAALAGVDRTDDACSDLLSLCLAYRRFALDEPELYGLMFERSVPGYRPAPERRMEAARTFDTLVDAIERCRDTGDLDVEDARATAFAVFGAIHGLVSLELTHLAWAGAVLHGTVAGADDPDATFVRYVEAIIRGLGRPDGRR